MSEVRQASRQVEVADRRQGGWLKARAAKATGEGSSYCEPCAEARLKHVSRQGRKAAKTKANGGAEATGKATRKKRAAAKTEDAKS